MTSNGLSELHAVAAVARCRSFRAAATALGISVSAVSHAVSALEKRLGVRLFNRTTRSVSLSEAGELFLARVEPALQEIALAMESVNIHRITPTGTLRINTSDQAALQVLQPLVLAFISRYKDMNVEIVTDGRLVDIVAAGCDAGIRLAQDVPQDMVSIPLGSEQRHIIVGSPTYLANRREPRKPTDLQEHICIRRRLPGGKFLRWELQKKDQILKVDVHGPLLLDNAHLALAAAIGGAGLAYVNDFSAHAPLQAGLLVQVLPEWTPSYPGLRLYYPSHRHVSAGLRALVAMAQELKQAEHTE